MIALGGVALGIAMGWVTSRLQERLADPMLELSMSLTTPFATYLLCESLHVSGVLGVVAVGLFRSRWAHRGTSALVRLNVRTVWGAIVFVVNCLVFMLIGIELPLITESLLGQQGLSWPTRRRTDRRAERGRDRRAIRVDLHGHVRRARAGAILAASRSRVRTRFHPGRLVRHARRRIPGCGARAPSRVPSGEPFPQRDLVILLAFGIVFVTLVGQGLTLPALVRGVRLKSDTSGETESELAREAMRRAAIQAVNKLVAEQGMPAHEAVAMKRFFNSRSPHRADSTLSPDSETRLWLGAAAAQRDALIDLWQNGEIGDDVLIYLEREIDLAEARLAREE